MTENIVKHFAYNRMIAKEHGIDRKKASRNFALISLCGLLLIILSLFISFQFRLKFAPLLIVGGFIVVIGWFIYFLLNIGSVIFGNIAYAVIETGIIF